MAESTHETNDARSARRRPSWPGGPRPRVAAPGTPRFRRPPPRRFRDASVQSASSAWIRRSISTKGPGAFDRFVTHGKILPRRMTGTCSRHMRMLTRAIKRARVMALLPYTLR